MEGTRPSIVVEGSSETHAVGTKFEVHRCKEDVAERVSSPLSRLVMRGGAVASLTQVDTSEALAWQSGILQFRDVTLGEAIAELNRYSETKLRVDDPALAEEHLSGAFPAGDQDMFAETLRLYLPVELIRTGEEILVTPATQASP